MPKKFFKRNTINGPRLLLCEGASDEAFFRKFIESRKLPEFSIRVAADSGVAGGITGFSQLLLGIATWKGFDGLSDIVIVADNDDDPSANFSLVQDQIRTSQPKSIPPITYGVPSAPRVTEAGTPASMSVLMLPDTNQAGCLECLCLQSAENAHPDDMRCVTRFADCVDTQGWGQNSISKMKLSALIAGKNRKNPFLGVGKIWKENPNLIPLDDPCFDHIADFLNGF